MKLKELVLAGSLFLAGCGTLVVPLATINNEWIYPYVEKKDGRVAAHGLAVTPTGIHWKATRIFIDGGSRISPFTPDGIVDELIVRIPAGRFIYTRSSYTDSDGVLRDLTGDDQSTKELRQKTAVILDNATQQYHQYQSVLRSIGKLSP